MKSKLFFPWRLARHLLHRCHVALARLFADAPSRIAPRIMSRRRYTGTIIDLFATILRRLETSEPSPDISEEEREQTKLRGIDATIDVLRYSFPNVDYQWLIKRFDLAYESNYALKGMLALGASKRTIEERCALALKIYALLNHLQEDITHRALFDRICAGLRIKLNAAELEQLICCPRGETSKDTRFIQSIIISPQIGEGDFLLSEDAHDTRFRALRCANIMLIINDAPTPLNVRGCQLAQGDMLPLHEGQEIAIASRKLAYEHLNFLFLAKYSGVKAINFLHLDNDDLAISPNRKPNSIARVRLGLYLELEQLSDTQAIYINGERLPHHASVCTGYYSPLTIGELGPYYLADISQYLGKEKRFSLNATQKKILVSNVPDANRPGALMLTPGLAPESIFEVTYSRSSRTGELRILEGCSELAIDRQPIRSHSIELKDGDLISLSSQQALRCRFSKGMLDEETGSIEQIEVRGLFKDYKRGGKRSLLEYRRNRRVLDNVAFTLKRGEMACILGPSGSGKSTLLSLLAGHQKASDGTIYFNEEKLTPSAHKLRRHIAFIPREDILDGSLTVEEHMRQASIIRRPQLSSSDRMRRVQAVLNFIGLSHLAERRVGRVGERSLSDGERSRLNLGLDLTGTAEVYLVDEPISGLSSGDAERVIKTLEDMAEGRILVCSLHRPASSLLNRFDKVLILDKNGRMAFWGSPSEMVSFFKAAADELGLTVSPESVSAGGSDYVFEVLESPAQHALYRDTRYWQQRYEQLIYRKQQQKDLSKGAVHFRRITPRPHRTPFQLFKLFKIWFARTLLGRVRSAVGLYALLLEGPALGLLISGTLRAASEEEYSFYKALHISEYLFLSIVLAMFFGLMIAACEMLRDRPILKRESNYGIFTSGYLLAKIIVLTSLASIQCALYLLASNWVLDIRLMFWQHLGIMSLTAFIGIAISLMISTFVRSERVALNLVPLILVPQILLAGAIVRFEEMNDFVPSLPKDIFPALERLRHRVAYQDPETHDIKSKAVPLIAELCPLRYSFELIFLAQTENNRWQKELGIINERREYLKEKGTDDQLRFIQRAVLALNSLMDDPEEARRTLRRIRNAALRHDSIYLEHLAIAQEKMRENPKAQPLEFFYTNRELTSIREGIISARKDARQKETRGFFLAMRQPRPFSEMEQLSDEGSVSTILRNTIYLLLMGLIPIVISWWQIRRTAKKNFN